MSKLPDFDIQAKAELSAEFLARGIATFHQDRDAPGFFSKLAAGT